jgi:dTDP-4-dehydrorhamnose reductase
MAWSRPDYDLDNPLSSSRLVQRGRPRLVIHSAAWTDVDGCARDPGLAMRRNGQAVSELAEACRSIGTSLVLISTNEVFDGRRHDGLAYAEDDVTRPINAYGRSKLAGEHAAQRVLAGAERAPLWIVRTSWLYGPPGADFPTKIIDAARRLPEGAPLRLVSDEFGSPTYAADLADAVVSLVAKDASPGTYHLVNGGMASRADWARRGLASANLTVPTVEVSQREFVRASTPPSWGVLDPSKGAAEGVVLRTWEAALDDYLATVVASR